MRIAQLANFIGPASGGMKQAVDALGRGYVAEGVDRMLVVPGPVDRITTTEHGDVVQVASPEVGGGYRLIVEPWRLVDVLERFRPTSIEWHDKLTLLPIAWWARRNRVRSICLSHEQLTDMLAMRSGKPTTSRVSIGVVNWLAVRSFDTLVVTSRYAWTEFARRAATVGTPLVRVPLGVDLDEFRPHARPEPVDGVLRLTHFGRLSREKSPHLAVATAVELHRRGVPVRLDVYGDGPHRAELETFAANAPVTFHGFVAGRTELSQRIADADVSLSVCPTETFGLAVLEALASGTPVVTADRGGAAELIDGSCGATAAPTPAALADAVQRVAALPATGRRTAARRRAEQYPWSATVDRMLDLHQPAARLPVPA